MDVYDGDGNKLGDVPLSEKQRAMLDAGENVAVLYHTPQLLRHLLGSRSGSFLLTKQGERLVTNGPTSVKEFLEIQAAARAAREPN